MNLFALAAPCAVFVACQLGPSRSPLGGDYAASEATSTEPHHPRAQTAPPASEDAGVLDEAPEKHARVAASAASADPVTAAASSDVLRYDPFKTGDQIRADVSFSLSAELQGNSPDLRAGNNKLGLDAKLHVEIKVLKSSTQTLDELEVTLTPISLHTDFNGQSSDSKQDPPETYDVTLTGQTPSIRARSGATLAKEDRATLIVLITPLVEFHNHWARSPTLALKAGWSSKVPLAAPAFMAAPGDTVHVGPLSARFSGRDSGASGSVPFDLSLPIEWTSDLGLMNFDFNGRALLGARGRPSALDLSGPLTGTVGPAGSQFGLRGSAKFAATLTYP
ncbi:MAG TPA: hypothetical protein VNW92_11750 [Polyangiaceae bacterium]|nr:hypothetical protein [Polyangiaceae bacterium]